MMETERLRFRKITQDDFEDWKKILSDPETMSFYDSPYDDNGVQRWIDWTLGLYKELGFGLFAVILKETNEFIGSCGITLQNINGKFEFEIGYHFNKNFWHHGYATEAARFMKDYFFSNTDKNEVYSYMVSKHQASQNVALQNGMSFVKEYVYEGNSYTVFKITRDEWASKRKCNQ